MNIFICCKYHILVTKNKTNGDIVFIVYLFAIQKYNRNIKKKINIENNFEI